VTKNRTWIVIGVVVGVLAIAVVVAAATSGGDDDSGGKATAHETAPVTVDGTKLPQFADTSNDKAVGDTIPTLQGISFDGSPVTIEPNGKPQVIVFLSHGCPHCQAEVPRIVSLQKAGKLDGVDVTAVTTNTSPEFPNYPPSAWLAREHWPYRALADSKKMTAADAYGLPAFPYFVFVDKDGKVAARATGEIDPDALASAVKGLVEGRPLVSSSNDQSTAAN
jgi:thiol-disulfide isomerase/thioredoxin